jgi:hypothetical protein
LDAETITVDEFNANLLIYWVGMPREFWNACVSEIPDHTARHFAKFLEEHLVPTGYRPSPICFILGPFETNRIEEKKLELEPKYREIHEFWLEHVERRGITRR